MFSIAAYTLGSISEGILYKKEAIVFAQTISVKSEPNEKGTDQFILHEGVKVEIFGEEENWLRIKIRDGNTGWIQRQSIEQI